MSGAVFADPAAAELLLAGLSGPADVVVRLRRALARLPDPDRTLLRTVRIVSGQPPAIWSSGIEDLVRLVALAPGSAEILLARPELLPDLLSGDLGEGSFAPELTGAPDAAVASCRRRLNAARLGLAAEVLSGGLPAGETGLRYTALAEAAIAGLLDVVETDYRRRHGRVAGGRFAVLALGKLGGREMTAGSDLDLVLVYDADGLQRPSDGARPLGAQVYFARLANSFLAALTARRGVETLYEIDVRLSPWARKSAATVHREGFCRYYDTEAWTWEHMALTRARPIAGDLSLRDRLAEQVGQVLRRRRDPAALARDVDDMRRRIARHHAAEPPFDAKHRPGGLVDCEFVLQFLMLREAWRAPEVLSTSSAEATARLDAAGALTAADGEVLRHGLRLWSGLTCLGRLTEGIADADRRRRAILEIAGVGEGEIEATASSVRAVYECLLAAPSPDDRPADIS